MPKTEATPTATNLMKTTPAITSAPTMELRAMAKMATSTKPMALSASIVD